MPFVSDWVTLNGERAAIPPIRLQPLQKLTGQIKDRQGRAVAGARVFLPAGGPATATDAQGRFALAGINPGKAVILVEQTGFRLQGWLVDPSSHGRGGVTDFGAHERSPRAGHEAAGRSDPARGVASPGESPAEAVLA